MFQIIVLGKKVPGQRLCLHISIWIPNGKSMNTIFLSPLGKFAFFKAIVTGDPKPTVTWSRNNGDVSDTSRYQTKYDANSNEHTFEVSNENKSVSSDNKKTGNEIKGRQLRAALKQHYHLIPKCALQV